jgi:hypothetical protein
MELNKNIHQFIDDIPNILLLVKMKNGQIIGGFSERAMTKGINKIKTW